MQVKRSSYRGNVTESLRGTPDEVASYVQHVQAMHRGSRSLVSVEQGTRTIVRIQYPEAR